MRSILTVLCIVSSGYVMGNTVRDSVGVENDNGKQVILHRVEAKENYYSISRKYNVHPKDVMLINKTRVLQPGEVVKVPTERMFELKTAMPVPQAQPATGDAFFDYKVGVKETLFSIAKRFNTSVEEIKSNNNLRSSALSIGQILKIRQGNGNNAGARSIGEQASKSVGRIPSVASLQDTIKQDTTDTASVDKSHVNTNRYGVTARSERGVAVWIDDENLDSHKMLALHKTAPVGTVVKVTNPMTGKSTFAKVVGKYTENDTTKDVIIVITKATADLLGALDKRFQVSIEYGMPNE